MRFPKAYLPAVTALAMMVLSTGQPSRAQEPTAVNLSEGRAFYEADGQSIYRATCQACHMSEGQGASGAGAYPALASDPRLASASYAVMTVLYGRKGMPGFAAMLSDEQVAAVTNYARTHMGNQHPDAVTPTDVKTLRGTP
jgi:mono/diheme cytochrome c family protein